MPIISLKKLFIESNLSFWFFGKFNQLLIYTGNQKNFKATNNWGQTDSVGWLHAKTEAHRACTMQVNALT